jgi:hypothetical protein
MNNKGLSVSGSFVSRNSPAGAQEIHLFDNDLSILECRTYFANLFPHLLSLRRIEEKMNDLAVLPSESKFKELKNKSCESAPWRVAVNRLICGLRQLRVLFKTG